MNIPTGKKLHVNQERISYDFIDRKNPITLFCIHGINSSKDFIGNLASYEMKYNIFTYSYGDVRDLKIAQFVTLTKAIINKYFKNKQLIIITHSLGAYITTKLFGNKHIIKYIFINPIHPLTFEYKPFLKTLKIVEKKPTLFQGGNGPTHPHEKYIFSEIIEKRTKWYKTLLEIKDRAPALQQELYALASMKQKSVFIRSTGDFIISGKLLQQFLEARAIPCKIIHHPGHSPLIKETKKTHRLFDL